MHPRILPLAAGAAVALAAALPVDVSAQIRTPDCGALGQWAKSVDFRDVERLNPATTYAISKPLVGKEMEALFGKNGWEFTPDDVAAARARAKECSQEASRAKDREASRALGALEAQLGRNLGAILEVHAEARTALAGGLDTFDALPAGTDKFRATVALLKLREGMATRISTSGIGRETLGVVNEIVRAMGRVPEQEALTTALPRIEVHYEPLREAAIQEATAEVAAVPETQEGLRTLDRTADRIKRDLAPLVPEGDLAAVDTAAASRREAIEDTLLAQAKQQIDAAPAMALSHRSLNNVANTNPIVRGLSPARQQEAQAHANQRWEAIAAELTDNMIASLGGVPETLDGVMDLHRVREQVRVESGPVLGRANVDRFMEASATRMRAAAKAALPNYRKEIETIPENREGLHQLEVLNGQTIIPLGLADKEIGDMLREPAERKHKKIAGKIESIEKRSAGRALSGQTFVSDGGFIKVEFRDRSRVYITQAGTTQEARYEVDGNRVILRMPQANEVFERQGATLTGGGSTLRVAID